MVFVSVIVPALNEEARISDCLQSLLGQTEHDIVEIIVSDGGSEDRTVDIVKQLAATNPQLRLINNPARIQSAGFNRAARYANPASDILVRADAHATYDPEYVSRCVTALRHNNATSVVVPMHTVGVTGLQRAIAAAQNSRIGNGGSKHRSPGSEDGPIDHGHHAAFDRAYFLSCGGYDESFTHNEDAEFDYRARAGGGLIWMCESARVNYYPRATLAALFRQYLAFGRGRCRTARKHRMRLQLRQLLPVAVPPLLLLSMLLAPLHPVMLLLPAGYVAVLVAAGILLALEKSDPWLLAAGAAAATMHFAFSAGFLSQSSRVAGDATQMLTDGAGAGQA